MVCCDGILYSLCLVQVYEADILFIDSRELCDTISDDRNVDSTMRSLFERAESSNNLVNCPSICQHDLWLRSR